MKKQITIASAPAALLAGTVLLSATSDDDATSNDPAVVESVEVVEIPHVPGIAPNQLNPIVAAPEYGYAFSPNEILNMDESDYSYQTWSSMDTLNDLYQLAETVRLRQAVEKLNDTLESNGIETE